MPTVGTVVGRTGRLEGYIGVPTPRDHGGTDGHTGGVTARQLLVHGVVQGVGFRWALAAQAERAGVRGWVRNRAGGSVEAHLEGAPDAVQSIIEWAQVGPRYARVSHVEVHSVADEAAASFEIGP